MGAPGDALKIVLILPELEEGGVERHVVSLSAAYVARGHEVLVVSRGGTLVRALAPGVRHGTMPVHAKNPLTAAWSAIALAKEIRREKWHIIHAESRVPAWVAWWASALAGVPWGATAQSCYSCNVGLFPFRRADFVVACSEAVRRHQEACQPGLSMEVIPDGVPPPGLSWRGPSSDDPVTFLFAGRLTAVKGIDLAVDAFLELPEGLPPWRFLVAGDGPLRENLENRVRRAGMESKISFLGFQQDVFPLMARSSCLIFPSRVEGMPLVLSEAMAMGVPVLASDIEAVRGMVKESHALVSGEGAGLWAKKLEEIIIKGAPPPLTPSGDFGFDSMVERYLATYRRVIEEKAGDVSLGGKAPGSEGRPGREGTNERGEGRGDLC